MTRKSASSPESKKTVAARVEPDADDSQPAGLAVPQNVSLNTWVVCDGPSGTPSKTPVDVDHGLETIKTGKPALVTVATHEFRLTYNRKTYKKCKYCEPRDFHNPLDIVIDEEVR